MPDEQVAQLARTWGELKTERGQTEVDGRGTLAAFGDAERLRELVLRASIV